MTADVVWEKKSGRGQSVFSKGVAPNPRSIWAAQIGVEGLLNKNLEQIQSGVIGRCGKI